MIVSVSSSIVDCSNVGGALELCVAQFAVATCPAGIAHLNTALAALAASDALPMCRDPSRCSKQSEAKAVCNALAPHATGSAARFELIGVGFDAIAPFTAAPGAPKTSRSVSVSMTHPQHDGHKRHHSADAGPASPSHAVLIAAVASGVVIVAIAVSAVVVVMRRRSSARRETASGYGGLGHGLVNGGDDDESNDGRMNTLTRGAASFGDDPRK